MRVTLPSSPVTALYLYLSFVPVYRCIFLVRIQLFSAGRDTIFRDYVHVSAKASGGNPIEAQRSREANVATGKESEEWRR